MYPFLRVTLVFVCIFLGCSEKLCASEARRMYEQAVDVHPAKISTVVKATLSSYEIAGFGEGRSVSYMVAGEGPDRWTIYPFKGATGHLLREDAHVMGSLAYNAHFGTVISYRGSHCFSDFFTDIDAKLVPAAKFGYGGTPGKIHRGFAKAAASTRPHFAKALNSLMKDYREASTNDFYVCGHSLAGALAKLSAIELKQSGIIDFQPNQLKTLTFACPQLGDKAFVEHIEGHTLLKANVLNFYAVNDPIPGMPSGLLGYKMGIGYNIPIPTSAIEVDILSLGFQKVFHSCCWRRAEGARDAWRFFRGTPLSVLMWCHSVHEKSALRAYKHFQVKLRSGSLCMDDLPSVISAPSNSLFTQIYKFLFS
ncbi:MAG: lipase family protein [Alphaproteobacteria bacterium]|nr:MAG: lipase family protein [Alphaproteobacteria bacterium]